MKKILFLGLCFLLGQIFSYVVFLFVAAILDVSPLFVSLLPYTSLFMGSFLGYFIAKNIMKFHVILRIIVLAAAVFSVVIIPVFSVELHMKQHQSK